MFSVSLRKHKTQGGSIAPDPVLIKEVTHYAAPTM